LIARGFEALEVGLWAIGLGLWEFQALGVGKFVLLLLTFNF
jgi:hypothetical protein